MPLSSLHLYAYDQWNLDALPAGAVSSGLEIGYVASAQHGWARRLAGSVAYPLPCAATSFASLAEQTGYCVNIDAAQFLPAAVQTVAGIQGHAMRRGTTPRFLFPAGGQGVEMSVNTALMMIRTQALRRTRAGVSHEASTCARTAERAAMNTKSRGGSLQGTVDYAGSYADFCDGEKSGCTRVLWNRRAGPVRKIIRAVLYAMPVPQNTRLDTGDFSRRKATGSPWRARDRAALEVL